MQKSDYFFILIIISLSVFLLSKFINKPFYGLHDWNANIWTITAKNNLKYGIFCTKLGQATNSYPVDSCSQFNYYMNHPPLISWVLTLSYYIFGFYEWAGRLPIILISTGSLILLFLIGKSLKNSWMGLFTAIIALFTPMFQYFGKSLNHEPLAIFTQLLSFYFFLQWQQNKQKFFKLLIFSTVLASLSSWQTFFLFPAISIFLWFKNKQLFKKSIILILIFVLIFIFHQTHTYLISGKWNFDIFNQLLHRIYGGNSNSADASIIQFSYLKFFIQEIRWLKIYYSILFFISTFIFIARIIYLKFINHKSINNELTILILGFSGLAVPLIFSQQAFIHEYINFYLLPFFALSAAYIVFTLLNNLKLHIFICLIFGLIILFENKIFLETIQKREAEKQYVDLARFLNKNKGSKNSFIILADNYYNFAYPFIWNYSYGAKTRSFQNSFNDFLINENNLIKNYQSLIVLNDHPIDPHLKKYLENKYPFKQEAHYLIFWLNK